MQPKDTRLGSIRYANHTKKEEDYRTARMEDYLEVIYELIQYKGYATTIDISEYLNVSSPSVTKMVQKLNESGHLNYEKYRDTANKDAEGIEHYLQPKTLGKLENFIKDIKQKREIKAK
jgi:Mn-dependent DtxR family transcriptional regulator